MSNNKLINNGEPFLAYIEILGEGLLEVATIQQINPLFFRTIKKHGTFVNDPISVDAIITMLTQQKEINISNE